MTRKEETRKASIAHQMSVKPQALGGDAFADLIERCNVNPSFIAGAEWADKTMLEKACKWLDDNAEDYVTDHWHEFDTTSFVLAFKRAMED